MGIATSLVDPVARPISSNLTLPGIDGTLPATGLITQAVGLTAVANGILQGAEPGRGTQRDMQPGRCYDFDGTDDYIDYGSIGSVLSYSLWVEPDSITSTTDYVLDLNGTDYLTIVNGTVTLNGQTGTIYVDGVAGSTIPDITDLHLISVVLDSAVTASDCDLGRVEGAGFYDGLAFDLRLYPTTLTASEVQELSSFAADALPNKATVLHAKCDDIHATISYDSSGNSNAGTKTNHTTSTFHYEGSDVPFSWQNDKGYTLDGTDLVPRDESDKTKDVFGGALQYTGKCPRNAKVIESNCAHLDGTNDYVEVADHADFDITNNLSLFIRHKNDSASLSGFQNLINKSDAASQRSYSLGINSSEKLFAIVSSDGQAGTQATVTADSAFTDLDSDHSYGMTFDGTTLRLYRDGLEVPSSVTDGSLPATIHAGTANLQIGSGPSTNYVDGTLYDARIFSGASAPLTAADMLALHNQTADSLSGQTNVLWLPMAEGNGNNHYCAVSSKVGEIKNHATGTYFGTKQDVFPYNYKYGLSKRQNKFPYASTLSGFTNNNLTISQVAGPYGGSNALRLIPDDTSSQTYRMFGTCTDSGDDEYIVMYVKKYGTAYDHVAFKYTGGSGGNLNIDTGEIGIFNSGMTLISNRVVGDWRRVALRIDSESGGVLQIGPNDETSSVDGAWSPPSTSDGIDIFIGVVEDPEVDPYPTTGTAVTDIVSVPALADGSADAVGLNIMHPAGAFHNLSESKIDFKAGVDFPEKDYSIRDNLLTTVDLSSSVWSVRGTCTKTSYQLGPSGAYSAILLEGLGLSANDCHNTDYLTATVAAEDDTVSPGVWLKQSSTSGVLEISHPASAALQGDWSVDLSLLSGDWEWVTADHAAVTVNTAFNAAANGSVGLLFRAESGQPLSVYVDLPNVNHWHEATAYIPPTRPTLPRAWEPPVNKVLNPGFSGAVAGTPGTVPTSWIASLQNGTLGVSGEELTFSASANRHFMTQPQEMVAHATYEYELTCTTNSGTIYPTSVMSEESTPSGVVSQYFVDGVPWDGLTALVGTQVIKRVHRTAATASSGFRIRVGMGVGNTATGSATVSNPTFKRIDENPAFSRQITKNGVLHRVDRTINYAAPLVGERLTSAETYTAATTV